MSYQALARKYRPQRFDDIIGQETVVRTLQNAIEQKRIHHAYLFSGVRGVGKTTLARILAKALNCVKGPTTEPDNECSICREITEGIDMDVREIDAATYTGVDSIRELRDVTQFQPARDHYRIFIIDEAHMLSAPAWNALLKLIEEPPEHVVFMFATTEMQKVPATILSRVQKFALRKITLDELIDRLATIASSEKIEADRAALETIARRGEGSVRDSLSLLDQVIAFSGRSITDADVATVLGLSDSSFFGRVVTLIGDGDHAAILEAVNEAASSGRDFKMLYRDLLNFVRNLLLIAGGAKGSLISASPEDMATIESAAKAFSYSELLRIANLLIRDDEIVNRAEHQRLAVEVALLKAATFPRLREVESVLSAGQKLAPVQSQPRPAKKAAAEGGGATKSAAANDDVQPLIDRLQKAKPLIAGYLAMATTMRKSGDRVIFTFDDKFTAESVSDARQIIEEAAKEIYGGTVKLEVASGNAPDKPAAAPAREDPVLKAFQKHLGGEVVETRRSK
jgi:DNA polymerase-3 subunit gamma/tau